MRGLARYWALRQDVPRALYYSAAVAGFGTVVLAWWWLSHSGLVETAYLPPPETVWETAGDLLRGETLWSDLKISFLRVTAGFLLSAALGVPLGIWIGSFKLVEGFMQPLTEFVRYVPVPALIPILMLLFDLGELSKVMLIFVGTFFQLTLMVADEIRRAPYELLQVSYTLGARRGESVRLVLWNAAKPSIFDAELIAANEGLGFRVLKFYRFVQTPKIFVYLILLGAVGLLLDFAFRKMNQRLFHWADTTKR